MTRFLPKMKKFLYAYIIFLALLVVVQLSFLVASKGIALAQTSVLPDSFSITGFVFIDNNRNRIQDPNEPGFANATLILYAYPRSQTSTNSSGFYGFYNLSKRWYSVYLKLPVGYRPTTPLFRVVYLSPSSPQASINFGIVPVPTYSVSGVVFEDADKDRVRDLGEPGVAGVTVNIYGRVYRTVTTNAKGEFLVAGLPEGGYGVKMITPPGYKATTSYYKSVWLNSDKTVEFGIAPWICGGFQGLTCPWGYYCCYNGGMYPDATGVCISRNEYCILSR